MNHYPPANRDDAPDDVDQLFARLERAPVPPELTARVLGATVGRPTASAIDWPWLLATLGGLIGLASAGYLLGAQLAMSAGLDLLEAVLADTSLLASAPGDVLAAFASVLPWTLLLIGGACLALVLWASGHVLSQPAASLRSQRG